MTSVYLHYHITMKHKDKIMNKPKTIVCDIDGVLLEDLNLGVSWQVTADPLEGTL